MRLRLRRARSTTVRAPYEIVVAGSMAAGKVALVQALVRDMPVTTPVITVKEAR